MLTEENLEAIREVLAPAIAAGNGDQPLESIASDDPIYEAITMFVDPATPINAVEFRLIQMGAG